MNGYDPINIDRCVYLPSDIAKILAISKTTCYDFLNDVYKAKEPFRVIKIRGSIRIPRKEFDLWLLDKAC